MPSDTIVQVLDQLHGLGNATRLHFLRALDDLDRTDGWQEDGAKSLEDWVAFRYAMPWKSAVDHVEAMRALRRLPAIGSAFERGMFSWEVLVILCSFVSSEDDEQWAQRAQGGWSPAQIQDAARSAGRRTRAEAARLHGERFLHAWWDRTGDFLRLHGMIPGADGALIAKTLDRIADQLGPSPSGEFEHREKRLADALVELAGTRVANDADPDRATVVIQVDARQLADLDGKGLIETGPDVSSQIVRASRATVASSARDPISAGRHVSCPRGCAAGSSLATADAFCADVRPDVTSTT